MPAIATILPLILQLFELAPQLIQGGKRLVDAAVSIWDTVAAEVPPTPEERAQYEAAFRATHEAFQASATRVDPDDPDVA